MDHYLLICLIFFLAGFTQGVSGFGSGLVAMPLLTMLISVRAAVPLCILNGLFITSYLTYLLKEHHDWRRIMPMFLASLPGVGVGVIALKTVDPDGLKMALGVLVSGYCLFRFLVRHPAAHGLKSWWGWLAGFLSGAISAAISAGGPPVVIYTTLTGWSKDTIKSTLSVFFLLSGLVTAGSHVLSGATTVDVLRLVVISCPFVLGGVVAGSTMYARINTELYLKLIMILLTLSGFFLIWSSL